MNKLNKSNNNEHREIAKQKTIVIVDSNKPEAFSPKSDYVSHDESSDSIGKLSSDEKTPKI
eukprot:UN30183